MLDVDDFRDMFLGEAEDLLAALEAQLSVLRSGGTDEDAVQEAFRAVHSIKGGAGALRLGRIVEFAHRFETFLDLAREGKLSFDPGHVDLAFAAFDMLSDLVGEERQAGSIGEGAERQVADALDEAVASVSGSGPKPAPVALRQANDADDGDGGRRVYLIQFRPAADTLKLGSEPLYLIRALSELGELSISADLTRLPELSAMDPAELYLSWTLRLTTEAARERVEEVFEFVNGDIQIETAPDERQTIVASDPGMAGEPTLGDKSENVAANRPASTASIRVDLQRLDRLVNLVGEIAISQAMVAQHLDQELLRSHPRLIEEIEELRLLTHTLQDSVMAIRAQPVQLIFARIPRLVRELTGATGKAVRLETRGETTEIDKTVVDQLYDPIMHMIRNAVDHGIEDAEIRRSRGKPAEGRIVLSAEQVGNRIVIRVQDDGGGIDRERVRRKAVEKKLIAADSDLSRDELDNLILLPSFSTAAAVSEISGRGVGMDVVRQTVQKLGGRIFIQSEPGCGTTVTLTLPLTLAVLDGMVVRVGPERYVVPVSCIVKSLRLRPETVSDTPGVGEVMRFRSDYVRLMRLEALFGIPVAAEQPERLAVVIEAGGTPMALVVDEIVGQQQIVIKTLEQNFRPVPGISGATILGDGDVALILDPTAIADIRPASSKTQSIARADNREKIAS